MSAHIITADHPELGLYSALNWLKATGLVTDSRNGRVVRAPGPVITAYQDPRRRVMLNPLRDANPFFHLYESIWMLAGMNDVESVARYAKQMAAFSDDGEHLHGAYGWRWREFFGFDQLRVIVEELRSSKQSRRAVLTMWAPNGDLIAAEGGVGGLSSKDVPCNTHVYFDASTGFLDMTVCNRSNDVVWGCYGANVVHMSVLQEFVAAAIGCPVGIYYQMSNNFHMYLDREDCQRLMSTRHNGFELSNAGWTIHFQPDTRAMFLEPAQLMGPGESWEAFLVDAEAVAEFPTADHYGRAPFLRRVVVPMMRAYADYKVGDFNSALAAVSACAAHDWRVAGTEWLQRRQRAAILKARQEGADA